MPTAVYPDLMIGKKELIDVAFSQYSIRSIADIGGAGPIGGVQGGYAFYCCEQYGIQDSFIVDGFLSNETEARIRNNSAVTFVQGNFDDKKVLDRIGNVDAVFFFDVLLHQVKPDWQEILALYAKHAKIFLIYNQQYTVSRHSVRLIDLGEDGYLRNVLYTKDSPHAKDFFERPNERMPGTDRLFRDTREVWQWGITDSDVIDVMRSLGFSLQWSKNYGHYGSLPDIEEHAFLFASGK